MSALDERLVRLAVALSPEEHREVRLEQWRADVRDAHELDLSPLALALGALTTAILHRTRPRRSTWETTVTVVARPVVQPHTIRTVPLLISFAFASVFVAFALIALLGRYGGSPSMSSAKLVAGALLILIPMGLLVAATLLVENASRTRRIVVAAIQAAGVVLFAGSVTGAFLRVYDIEIGVGIAATGMLAGWLLLKRLRGRSWSLLALPIVVFAAVQVGLLSLGAVEALPVAMQALLYGASMLVPFAGAVVGGIVAGAQNHGAGRETLGRSAQP